MKQLVKSLAYILSLSLIVFLLPLNQANAAPIYIYEWVSQSGTISNDGLAHEYTNLEAGQTIDLSLTLVNRSGITIVGKSNLTSSPDKQVPVGVWGIGSQTPYQDGTPSFLDLSSFVLNNNRFTYYDGPNVPDDGILTMSWTIKLKDNLSDGVYNLYVRPVSEYLAWTRQIKNNKLLPTTSSDIFWRLTVGENDLPIYETQSLVYSSMVREEQGSSSCQNCSTNDFSLYKFNPSTGTNIKFYSHIQNKDTVEKSRWGLSYARILNNDLIHVIRRVISSSDNIAVNNVGEVVMSGLERPESIISPNGALVAYPEYVSNYIVDLKIKNLNTGEVVTYNVSSIPDAPAGPNDRYKSLFPILWSTDSKKLYLQERYAEDFGAIYGYKFHRMDMSSGDISPHYNSTSLNFNSGSISPLNGALVGYSSMHEGMMSLPPSRIEYTHIDGEVSKLLVDCPNKICTGAKISNKGDQFAYLTYNYPYDNQVGSNMFLASISGGSSSAILIDDHVRHIYEWSADDRYIVYTRALSGSSPAVVRIYDVWNKNIHDVPHIVTDSNHEYISPIGFIQG